jgi:hypothetical protein
VALKGKLCAFFEVAGLLRVQRGGGVHDFLWRSVVELSILGEWDLDCELRSRTLCTAKA